MANGRILLTRSEGQGNNWPCGLLKLSKNLDYTNNAPVKPNAVSSAL
jgi:hypothetical protein